MIKLLIFGDSFGEEQFHWVPPDHPMYQTYTKLISYHSILRKSNIFESVTVHATGGSDLWSQYKLFNEHYTGTESVLWFETDPLRINGPNDERYTSVTSLENTIINERSQTVKTKMRAAINYFLYLQNDDYCMYVHKKMIEDIKAKCPNVYILPGFPACTSFKDFGKCLAEISSKERMDFGVDRNIERTHYDIRRNHITETNHNILAEQLIKYYKDGTPVDLGSLIHEHGEPMGKYFFKRSIK
jgi:hypothetical protein